MDSKDELIDWEQLDMMADGYTPDFVAIYQEFLAQTPELLDLLEKQLQEGDVEAVRDTAHKIKGSSANFGFVGVSFPMAGVELEAKEKGSLEGSVERTGTARENFEKSRAEIREKRGI